MTWTGTPGAPTVPPQPPGPQQPPAGSPAPNGVSRRSSVALVCVFVALLVGVAGALIHPPYAIMMPGPASNVLGQTTRSDGTKTDLILIDGHPTFPTTGSLDFTTVRVSGGPGYPVNVWSVLSAWVDPTEEVYPVDTLFPQQQTQEQVQQENTTEMVDSQQQATAVALRKAGIAVPEKVSIAAVSEGAPSGSALAAGDVLVSVGGTPVTSAATARAAIQKTTPGGAIDIVVERKGAQVPVSAKTGTSSAGRAVLGVVLRVDFIFPFKVTIDAGSVGGPSAGLMFSLGIYDKLTEGSLTGGKNIAGTGTIDDSGAVGQIGGIRQKMVGAQRSGATFFLAPAGDCTEVRDHVPDGLQVVKVATFDEGEAAVQKIGVGDTASLPGC